jgi:hypothetical protein
MVLLSVIPAKPRDIRFPHFAHAPLGLTMVSCPLEGTESGTFFATSTAETFFTMKDMKRMKKNLKVFN